MVENRTGELVDPDVLILVIVILMIQRIVDLDMAVKTALHLERPEPEKCIAALDELETIAVTPLVLKKQPDIFTTIRWVRVVVSTK